MSFMDNPESLMSQEKKFRNPKYGLWYGGKCQKNEKKTLGTPPAPGG